MNVPPEVVSVLAVGASAGGLEALERFLARVPTDTTRAIVVIQHLDPTSKGLLTELLGQASALPVVEVTDALRLAPGRVHVIPPGREMIVVGGVLRLRPAKARRGEKLPIDIFFRSLAEDHGPNGVGVVLSGMGSDGTAGAAAIREKGGAVFVQSPSEAKFPSMPQSVIDAGLADAEGLAADLPEAIEEHLGRAAKSHLAAAMSPDRSTRDALESVVSILHRHTGQDFSLYKRSTMHRRVQRRMAIHQHLTTRDYVRYLERTPSEAELLFKELLIGVTSFFRDPAVWERVKTEIFPRLITQHEPGSKVRVWTPACSSGEEAYSIGIAFKEAVEAAGVDDVGIQIFATDLDETAIERARTAAFPVTIEEDVSAERLARFFVREKRGGYRVRKEIRDLVVFATHNVINDPPFTKLDFLSCRNLLIYLAAELQARLLPLFHYSLNPGGVLLLGNAETVGSFTDLFSAISGDQRLYERARPVTRAGSVELAVAIHPRTVPARPPFVTVSTAVTGANAQLSIEQFLLKRFAPASVLASTRGDILFVNGRTGPYLELPAGKANWNLFTMAREGLRHSLIAAFQRARRTNEPVVIDDVEIDGERRALRVSVEPVDEPGLRGAFVVVFEQTSTTAATRPTKTLEKSKKTKRRTQENADETLALELRASREELDELRAEMQSSEEELKSTNEELQSTNEELQSTNEELTTSKEEMQSINEELRTLNSELQAKVEELSRASNDMNNLLDSTEIAVLFLDEALNVRRFMPKMTTLINLIPSDVGRPLADLASQLDYGRLREDAREVLRTLAFIERKVESKDRRSLRVRIMPYRTSDNRIDGLVMTFTNVLSS